MVKTPGAVRTARRRRLRLVFGLIVPRGRSSPWPTTTGGAAYYELDQDKRALQNYDKAIQLDPDYAKAYYGRGVAYYDLGQDAKAYADKDKACSLDSKYC